MPHSARFTGDYSEDWRAVSAETRAGTGHRCARCRHPFQEDGRPMPCDEQCDRTRGRLIDAHQLRMHPAKSPHRWADTGLNFGVHHLDGRKDNNAWWNRLALCNSCHLTIQARVIPERPYLFTHSDWFRPYVAGFYAFYYGGVQITREGALAHVEFWLSLGQPWLYVEQPAVPPDWWTAMLDAQAANMPPPAQD